MIGIIALNIADNATLTTSAALAQSHSDRFGSALNFNNNFTASLLFLRSASPSGDLPFPSQHVRWTANVHKMHINLHMSHEKNVLRSKLSFLYWFNCFSSGSNFALSKQSATNFENCLINSRNRSESRENIGDLNLRLILGLRAQFRRGLVAYKNIIEMRYSH